MKKSILSTLLLAVFIGQCLAVSTANRSFNFINNCNYTVWVGSLNNPNKDLPQNGGWAVAANSKSSISLPYNWAGRFWGRTECNFNSAGKGTCTTGDCGGKLACSGAGGAPPASLMEFTLSGAGGLDFYDVSLVDGYNLPVAITPVAGTYTKTGSDSYSCGTITCTKDLNTICPSELQKKDSAGVVVACMSACEKFNTDQYCCRNAYGTPAKCPPTAYSQVFKEACPDAYSYAYDDTTSTYTCTGASYDLTFCPSGAAAGTPAASSTTKAATTAASTTVASTTKAATTAASSTTKAATTTTSAPATSTSSDACSIKCGTGLSCCAAVSGNACYNPSVYTCSTNEKSQKVLCPAGYNSCGTACFSSAHYTCTNGKLKNV